jgi:hypothetical protein
LRYDVSEVRHDAHVTVFRMTDDLGAEGFGVARGAERPDPSSIKFHPVAGFSLQGEAAVSAPYFAYLASEGLLPVIFGVTDVEAWSPAEVIRFGDDLPGGHQVSDLGAFDLAGRKLVVHARKAVGAGLYGMLDIGSPSPFLMLATGEPVAGIGDITGFGDVSTDGQHVLVHVVGESGEALVVGDDFGATGFTPVIDTSTVFPNVGNKLTFDGFGQVAWQDRAVFHGRALSEQGIYFDGGAAQPGVVLDTLLPCPNDLSLFFTDFRTFSVQGPAVLIDADGSDGSCAVYLEQVGKASQKIFQEGDVLVDGRKVESFAMTDQAAGSLFVAAQLDDGTQNMVFAEAAIPVPALPLVGLALLLVSGLYAVATSRRETLEKAPYRA